MGFNVLKSTSKAANPLKQADRSTSGDSSASLQSKSSSAAKGKPPSSMTMAEKIMHDELERKKRKLESSARSSGPQMQQGVKRSSPPEQQWGRRHLLRPCESIGSVADGNARCTMGSDRSAHGGRAGEAPKLAEIGSPCRRARSLAALGFMRQEYLRLNA
ncbi:hypothetical protein L1887_53020 [Cichorium endivia]|nr:hypothetical protein L1887_53020 [Cichorium endivia]